MLPFLWTFPPQHTRTMRFLHTPRCSRKMLWHVVSLATASQLPAKSVKHAQQWALARSRWANRPVQLCRKPKLLLGNPLNKPVHTAFVWLHLFTRACSPAVEPTMRPPGACILLPFLADLLATFSVFHSNKLAPGDWHAATVSSFTPTGPSWRKCKCRFSHQKCWCAPVSKK